MTIVLKNRFLIKSYQFLILHEVEQFEIPCKCAVLMSHFYALLFKSILVLENNCILQLWYQSVKALKRQNLHHCFSLLFQFFYLDRSEYFHMSVFTTMPDFNIHSTTREELKNTDFSNLFVGF